MLSPEEIDEQQQLLAANRRTLAVYLEQQALLGRAYSPPALINGIADTRRTIKHIKAILSATGATIPEDPDDESPIELPLAPTELPPEPSGRVEPLAPPLQPAQGRAQPPWVWLAITGVLALTLVIVIGWALFSRLSAPPDSAAVETDTPAAEAGGPSSDQSSPEPAQADLSLQELEGQLAEANIALSATQADQVREYINDASTGYKALAEHALQVLGNQRFRDPLYLDELDVRYTQLVGEAHYLDFNEDELKEAMVRAWNEHYTDNQVDTFDQMLGS